MGVIIPTRLERTEGCERANHPVNLPTPQFSRRFTGRHRPDESALFASTGSVTEAYRAMVDESVTRKPADNFNENVEIQTRWVPGQGAWQRMLNQDGIYAAKQATEVWMPVESAGVVIEEPEAELMPRLLSRGHSR